MNLVSVGAQVASGLLTTLDSPARIRVVLAGGLMMLLVIAAVVLVRRPERGGPAGWMALGAAISAQVFFVLGSILELFWVGTDAVGAPQGASQGFAWVNAATYVVVFLLTLSAYVGLRERAVADASGRGVSEAGKNRTGVLRVALGLAATLVVVTGIVASATRSSSPVACVDVTKSVGIEFRGALGNAIVDGSDRSAEMQQHLGNGVAIGDYNQDGNLDLYMLGQPGHENRLYRNHHTSSGEGFTDVTDVVGLGGLSGSRAAQFIDLDIDGRLDIVVVNDYQAGTALQPSRIYGNISGNRFEDVTGASGFDPIGLIVGGLAIADYNKDGLPDIYVAFWTGGMELGATYAAQNLLFENLGDFRFREVADQIGLGSLSTGSFTPLFADLNGDSWPDLYLTVDGAPERLFINDHGMFRDVTIESGLGTTRNGMGASLVDPEGTGVPSIYVTNITESEHRLGTPPGGNALLRSRLRPGGAITYVDDAAGAGVRDAGWAWGASFTDLNLDGYPDLFVAQGMDVATRGVSPALLNDRAHVFVGTSPGRFMESKDNGCDIPGDQRAVVAFDYNRDGAPDLLVSQVLHDYKLLENRSEPRGHWLTVVAGPTAGHTVVGARVTVIAGGRQWVQNIIGGGSYLSGPPNEVYFGLGSADRVTSITIDWPDGTTTERFNVTADRLVLMQKP